MWTTNVQWAILLLSFFSMITAGIMFVKGFIKFQVPLSKNKPDHWNLPTCFLTWLLKLFSHWELGLYLHSPSSIHVLPCSVSSTSVALNCSYSVTKVNFSQFPPCPEIIIWRPCPRRWSSEQSWSSLEIMVINEVRSCACWMQTLQLHDAHRVSCSPSRLFGNEMLLLVFLWLFHVPTSSVTGKFYQPVL